MTKTSRSTLAVLALSLAALAIPAGASAAPKGFEYGVTAAEVDAHSAILWARANKPGGALLQVDPKGRFGQCSEAIPVKVTKANDNTVQKRVSGLTPNTKYLYRFCMSGGRKSATGTFRTAPAPAQAKTIHFALTGDQDALPLPGKKNPYWNDFGIWDQIKKEGNDFNVLLGDTIYSDTEVPGHKISEVATTVAKKWDKYKINLGQKEWTDVRGSAAYYGHWDDHEFVNDFSQAESRFPYRGGVVKVPGKTLYKRGVQAFQDYNPVTYSKQNGIYRSFRWGKNLEIFFLDERSFRSKSADYDGSCDNPPGSGDPDLAPGAPQSTRDLFGLIVPQLRMPVPPACTAELNDPKRTMLGKHQLATFENAIKSSKATWKVIFNEVPIQQYYALPYDRWEGYNAERTKLLTFLKAKTKNAIFLSTDVHANLVNDARLKTLEPGGPVNSGISEITTGPIATATYTKEIDGTVGEGNAPLIHDLFFKPPPPNGVGMQCAGLDQFSYSEVTVSKRTLKVDLRDINGDPVTDTADRTKPGTPCGPYTFTAK